MKTTFQIVLANASDHMFELFKNHLDETYTTFEEADEARTQILDDVLIWNSDQAQIFGHFGDHEDVDNKNYNTTQEAVTAHAYMHCMDCMNIEEKQVIEGGGLDQVLSTL